MKDYDLFDTAAELDGLAAILSILSLVYLDSEEIARPAERTTGEALFGAECLAKHIAHEVNAKAEEIYQSTLKKKA